MPAPNRDQHHLWRLRDHFARHGALPSYSGISDVVGFRAKNAAVKLVQRLTSDDYLRFAPGGRIAPGSRFFELPLAEVPVRAGAAEEVEPQMATELITLDSYLIDVPSKTVLIRIKGDSMRDAGLLDGDLAVVEKVNTAAAGQFVVALVDEGFTVKELAYDSAGAVLLPHNADFAPIRPASKLEIFGVVRGVVRRYKSDRASSRTKARPTLSGIQP